MRATAGAAQDAREAVLLPGVQEARGALAGVAREGLLALSVGIGLGEQVGDLARLHRARSRPAHDDQGGGYSRHCVVTAREGRRSSTMSGTSSTSGPRKFGPCREARSVEPPEPTHFIQFTMGDALPSSERMSSWVSVMALICNDAVLDSLNILRSAERPPHELSYSMRIAAGHLYEAVKFIANTAEWPEVQELVDKLSPERRAEWDSIVELWDRQAPLRPALDNARHQVFHYPKVYEAYGLGEVTAALERMAAETGHIELGEKLISSRFQFADALALDMIIEPVPGTEQEQFERFANGLRDHVRALRRCSEAVLGLFFPRLGTFVFVDPPADAS